MDTFFWLLTWQHCAVVSNLNRKNNLFLLGTAGGKLFAQQQHNYIKGRELLFPFKLLNTVRWQKYLQG